jgi:hypothetical protein
MSDQQVRGKYAMGPGREYNPTQYPGRYRWGEVHVFDQRGRTVYTDAIPGLGVTDGVMIDRRDNLYALAGCYRILDGEPYPLTWTSTLFKMAPGKGKVLSTNRTRFALPPDARPKRPPDMNVYQMGNVWVEGAEWIYGGIGFNGCDYKGGGCVCWNARCDLDDFARVFAPEVDHFTVVVLDTNGNLITRIGQYGNVDDGKPLIQDGGPANPRSIGGDEVALFHAAYVGTHTDRRLFISDGGNRRILSVKLGYHSEERIALKNVADQGQ